MLTTTKIIAAISGACSQPVKSVGGYDVSETKAIAYAVWKANGTLPEVGFAVCDYESGPDGRNDRRIKTVRFYTGTPFNSWTPYAGEPKGKPAAVVTIPHWDAKRVICDWQWYRKHRTAEDRRLGGKCYFAQPMPGRA